MPRRGLLGAACAAALLAGCALPGSDDGGRTIAPEGAPYRYVVPPGLRVVDVVEVVAGPEDARSVTAVGLDRDDLIVVSAYRLAAGADGLTRDDLVAELDRSLRDGLGADATIAGPVATRVANADAFSYEVGGTRTPDGDPARLRVVTAVRGTDQVLVLCRTTTTTGASPLLAACDRLAQGLELR